MIFFFFPAEDGIRDRSPSRGLGDVYKRQGVSSPVRAIKPYPFYTAQASGSHLTTVDGTELIDCCMAYGPLILGHMHPQIRNAIEGQLKNGWLFGTPSPLEPAFAKIITGDHSGMDMVRFVSSGSEATMAAI